LKSLITPNGHGSACIASGSKEVAVSQLFLLLQKAPVNLLSRTQLFLLCIAPCVARERYEPRLCVALFRSVRSAPTI
jgi:hypothetical protein